MNQHLRIFAFTQALRQPVFTRLLLLVGLQLGGHTLFSQNTTWNGSASTDWHTAANWSAGVPTDALNAIIDNATNQPTISLAGAAGAVARSVRVNASAILTIASTGTLAINDPTVYIDYGILNVGTIQNNGTITIAGNGNIGNGIDNLNIFNNNSTINIDGTLISGIINRSTFTNAGILNIGANASAGNQGIKNNRNFNNTSTGSININRVNMGIENNVTFTNAGTITLGAIASVGNTGIDNLNIFNNSTCAALINIVSNSNIQES